MEKILENGLELSKNEKGQLQGGFNLQVSHDAKTQFWADNGNCKGGGWFDTNTNCNRCSECDQHGPIDREEIQEEP